MSDGKDGVMSDAPRETSNRGLAGSIGLWASVLSAVIGTAHSCTTLINGYWADQAAQKKAAQELALSEIKERSALASEYLKLIIAKDTEPSEKVTLLDALASIEKHPLQHWARERVGSYRQLLARIEAAEQAQRRALEEKEGAEQEIARLQAEIERLTAEQQLARDDPAKREEFRKLIHAASGQLGQVKGRLGVTSLTLQASVTTLTQVQQRLASVQPPAGSPGRAPAATPSASPDPGEAYGLVNTINEITQKITTSMLAAYFPAQAQGNIEAAAPYLRAALQEFQITDRRMIAAIIATIAVETPRFENYEEPESRGSAYDGRPGLGNTQQGDGVLFRGRGYIGLTGRANYTAMSTRLGLGNRLVVSPEDAATPEIACRVLVAWFADRQASLRPALERGELGQARRIVAGSATRDIERFATVYNKVLAAL